jgi:hypothetical protein
MSRLLLTLIALLVGGLVVVVTSVGVRFSVPEGIDAQRLFVRAEAAQADDLGLTAST